MRFSSVGFFVAAVAGMFSLSMPAQAQTTFTNTTGITIPTVGTATPFPSTVVVSGLTGTISKITVTITGFSHTFPDDVGLLFTGPGNANPVILADAPGNGTDAVSLNWVFDDAAATTLPATGALASGTFKPGLLDFNDVFSAPAPTTGIATSFAAFLGASPNGIYNLYVQDFFTPDGGSITSWGVTITTTGGTVTAPEPASLALLLAAVPLGVAIRRRKIIR